MASIDILVEHFKVISFTPIFYHLNICNSGSALYPMFVLTQSYKGNTLRIVSMTNKFLYHFIE